MSKSFQPEFKIQTFREFTPQLAETQGNHAFSLQSNYCCEPLCLAKSIFSTSDANSNSFQMFQYSLTLTSLYV